MPPKLGIGSYIVNVLDVNERPSFLPSQPTTLTVVENSPSGTLLDTFFASDPDADDLGRLNFTWVNRVNSSDSQPMFAIEVGVAGIHALHCAIRAGQHCHSGEPACVCREFLQCPC